MTIPAVDTEIAIADLVRDPYPIYQRLRASHPVIKVEAVCRILLTKAEDTKWVKDNPDVFSSDDPNTPMRRAFLAHPLMRKDGTEHMRERLAMAPAYSAKNIAYHWIPIDGQIADDYIAGLPAGETVDLFPDLAGPFAARCLAQLLGLPDASDDDMQRWSQTLIDGAGNLGWDPALFEDCDRANAEMDACMDRVIPLHKATPNPSALCAMVTADDPIALLPENELLYRVANRDPIKEPHDAQNAVLEVARSFDPDIENFEDIFSLLVNRPDLDDAIAAVLIDSGYLEIWRIETEKHPWRYNPNLINKISTPKETAALREYCIDAVQEA